MMISQASYRVDKHTHARTHKQTPIKTIPPSLRYMATRVVNSRQQILEMGKSTQFVRPGKFMKVSYNDSLSVGWHYAIFM